MFKLDFLMIFFRRISDMVGSWKLANHSNMEALLASMQVSYFYVSTFKLLISRAIGEDLFGLLELCIVH